MFMYVYVCLCMFMYVYVCLCMFMYVYVSLCMFMERHNLILYMLYLSNIDHLIVSHACDFTDTDNDGEILFIVSHACDFTDTDNDSEILFIVLRM